MIVPKSVLAIGGRGNIPSPEEEEAHTVEREALRSQETNG